MTQIIMYGMAAGALLGGIDHLLGDRLGYGQRFVEAFRLLGNIALSMAGIICLAPVISRLLGYLVVPLFGLLGMDPGMFGSVLAIDMGGYQMAMDLAKDPAIGRFAGIVVSAMFGCTIVFTIPVGMGTMGEEDRPFFTKGILLGLISMPVGILAGGLLCGLPAGTLLWNCLPVFLISGFLLWGLAAKPVAVSRGFRRFGVIIEKIGILGLTLGAVVYMTGWNIPLLTRLEDAMEVVCSIAIVMLGSMPLAELIQRLLKVPFGWIGRHTGLNSASTTGLLVGMVSVTPALVMIPRMDNRGKVVCGAFLVCGASALAAHLGFAVATEPELVGPLLAGKLLGGILGIALALAATSGPQKEYQK